MVHWEMFHDVKNPEKYLLQVTQYNQNIVMNLLDDIFGESTCSKIPEKHTNGLNILVASMLR